MRLFRLLSMVLVSLVMATGAAFAQGVGASGDIRGTVTDPSGAVITNATVTATDAAKGTKRTGVSDNNGSFVISGLLPAIYNVSSQHSGFQTSLQKGVVVSVGETVILDFHLKLSSANETVEVTTEPPVVETDKAGQAETISSELITDLPINRRDYLTFTLLAPGVTDSTHMASDQDYRVKQTPQSGLSFYGSNGRGNSVTVDGGEANDDAGGVRLTLSQDAVQEFQINRSNYGADLGGASGATINIVSKSGTNDVHGSLFAMFRRDALDAANPFSFTQALQPGQAFNPALPDSVGVHHKDHLGREQFGSSIGFPINRDKTFLFAAFEGLMQDAQNAVPLLTNTNIFRPSSSSTNNQQAILNGLAAEGATPVPCLTGQPALPAATCAGILQNVLTVNSATSPRNAFLVNQFENNGGLFPYTTREYQTSARLDHQFSERNQMYLRYSFAHDHEENTDATSLTGFSRGSSIKPAYDHTLQGSWFHQFSPRTLNEVRLQFNYSHFDVIPNTPGEVGLDLPGFANLGTQIFLPSKTIMRRFEVADNITLVRGHHTLKFGGYELYRGNHSESNTFFPGRFVFGNLPGGIISPCLQVPAACGLTGTNPAAINALQSASLGLPQFYQQGFGNPVYNYPRPWTSFYAQDTWQIKPNFTFNIGVRYELDSQYGSLVTDKNNFGPRASIAWDPFKDHKTVIRAGYGIFYSPIYGQIADVVQTLGLVNGNRQIAQIFVPLTGAPGNPALTSAAIFQTLFAQGKVQCTIPAPGNAACITPADLAQFGIAVTHTGPVPPLTVLFSGQPNYTNPYSQQAEVGIEREIAKGWSVALSGIYVHTIGLPTAIDLNALAAAPVQSATLANGKTVSFHNWGAPQCTANPFLCFANPLLLQNNQYSSKGSSIYEGGILEVKKRFSGHFTLMANYTYSKAIDTATDFNSDFGPVDNTNLAGERGLSTFDQRHKIVVASVIDTGKSWGRALSGFQLSPIFRYNSGHPFNLLAGADVNGDRHSTNDRPIGAGRNTGLGPDYFSFDMRLTRQFRIHEKTTLQLVAEGFNLTNRINYGSVNNEVGPNFGLPTSAGGSGFTTFNVHGSNTGASTPLGFTSAFPMRQVQLGLRIGF
jgi:carboxypeptidase family protein